ncbi:MAG: hypothetical protein VX436_01850 [Planctomycetota bacterium]|nr:hypothetical protein [Planctomycetota bacterium]
MSIIFNLLIIGSVLLIAYWWANEGLLSAFLHLVCVITAGTIALAFWEPITMRMLSGGGFDNYVWGVTLVGMFAISLFALRMCVDKIVPYNIQFPDLANYVVGGSIGGISGILSVGLCLIGAGFLQSSNEIMSYRGVGRDENNRAMIGPVGDPIWLNVSRLTSNFYSLLSVGAFHPDITGTPLKHFNPNIDELSTLVRDSYDGGKGQLSLAPIAADVTKVAQSDDGLVVIQVTFNSKAKDYGGQLILGSSQVRLIGEASGNEAPDIYYPIAWKQEVQDIGESLFRFDDISHYATSVPGQQNNGIKFIFDTKDRTFSPRFIQIRGTRFKMPNEERTPISVAATDQYRGRKATDDEILAERDPLGKDIQHLIDVTSKIRKLRISTNGIPGTIEYDEENFFIEGTLTTQWSQQGVSAALTIKGIRADEGTVIVQLDVTPGSNAAFEDLLPVVPRDSSVVLIDKNNRKYSPIGYIIGDDKRMQLSLTPSTPIRTISEIPLHILTSSNKKSMKLLFQVTKGQWLKEFRVGDITIGTCNVEATSTRF